MLPSHLQGWPQRGSLMNPCSAVYVPATQIVWIICRDVKQCSTSMIVFVLLRIYLPISDGRLSLMLQERWEGNVVASIVSFFAAIWNVRSMCRRGYASTPSLN